MTLHPAFIIRGGWAWRGKVAEDLYHATRLREGTISDPLPVSYEGPWHPSQAAIPPGMPLAIDLETIPNTYEITQLNWSVRPCEAYSGPWNEPSKTALQAAMRARELVFHNAQFDIRHLVEAGMSVPEPWYDTMIASAILEPDLPNNLEHVARDYSDLSPWKHIKTAEPWRYGCIDADATIRAKDGTERDLRESGLLGVFRTSMEVLPELFAMWRHGLRLNPEKTREMATWCEGQEKEATAALNEMARKLPARHTEHQELSGKAETAYREAASLRAEGKKGEARKRETEAKKLEKQAAAILNVNWSSPVQLLSVLDQLELPRRFDHKTGRVTTDAATIQELARTSGNPILLKLLDFREHKKLRTTFFKHAGERLFPQYLLHRDYDLEGAMEGACSGRLASKDPNIQNWPKLSRAIVVPDYDGWEMMEADYNQIEARIMAWKAQGALWKAFNTLGFDIHRFVTGRALGKSPESVTDEERDKGKRVVYSAIYLVGALTLSRRLMADGIYMSVAECKRFIEAFHSAFPDIKRVHRRFLNEAFETQKITNPFGRYRRFYAPNAESTAIANFYPQSSAGDIILRAMARLRKELPKPARMAIQVHDSLTFMYPRELRELVLQCVRDCMRMEVPEMPGFSLPISTKIGENWGLYKEGVNEEGLRSVA